ncbi:hypothetical protein IT408_02705 [Candidatus Uhrbacteria bacterium]|nr:hypothetical protein [Candidatus Uhrbacteria bacterium]
MQQYYAVLQDTIDMFESCGCTVSLTSPSLNHVTLTINGPIQMCPSSIFEEYVDQAKKIMSETFTDIAFEVCIIETEY